MPERCTSFAATVRPGWSTPSLFQTTDHGRGFSAARWPWRVTDWSSARGGSWSKKDGSCVGYVYLRDDNGTLADLSDDLWVQETKLVVPPQPFYCNWGFGVGIAGDFIVVGHPTGEFSVGSASIFERKGGQWIYSTALVGSDTVFGDGFGFPVARSGNRVVVGAPYVAGGTGEVYVFRRIRSEWVEESKFSSIATSNLGTASSIDRNDLAVSGYTAAGESVSVFHLVGGTRIEQGQVTPLDAAGDRLFGGSVFIQGRRLFVSAEDGDENFGVPHFFERVGAQWFERQRLVPSDARPSAGFGGVRGKSGRYLVPAGALKVYVLRLDR